ncbi:HNH endonuclease signature motif containing protein [Burkholderia sp. S-53]|uniref:HNH endonuclease signature motif containing protein n=1 Tax=Burkholderia sp. S-53 TaxID=2906514 RepID=UPI0021CE3C80|nr:HNH endonuclease signature motif containing protein [Burkholderia sp. S-53]UXU91435.1 HNH endonuclease [Burkholderia sp. S-53]
MKHITLSADDIKSLREEFTYEPNTGALTRKGNPVKSKQFNIHANGKKRAIQTGRLVYALHMGEDVPEYSVVAHNNKDKYDRRWENLAVLKYSQLDKSNQKTKQPLAPHYHFLHECFEYQPDTGRLIWRNRPLHHFKTASAQKAFNNKLAGKPAGTINTRDGRRIVHMVSGQREIHAYTSLIIWVMHYGTDAPHGMLIDHADRNPLNDRLDNLRLATEGDNTANHSRKPGKSGVRGVNETEWGYQAQIKLNRKGEPKVSESKSFRTLEQATLWRQQKERQHFGEFAVLGINLNNPPNNK